MSMYNIIEKERNKKRSMNTTMWSLEPISNANQSMDIIRLLLSQIENQSRYNEPGTIDKEEAIRPLF
jgi:hypothetical protein